MQEMNYSYLRGRMAEKGINQKSLAEYVGLTPTHLGQKLLSRYPFTQQEIMSVCDCLDIGATEIDHYFFTPKVEKAQ